MAGSKVWFAADPAAATGFSSTGTGESIRTRPRDFSLDGPHGLSEVIDPTTYAWHDDEWGGLPLKGQVLYELHVGTFTRGRHLGQPRRAISSGCATLGVTAIQMMPVAEFAGRVRLGLRRRQLVRADPPLRRARRPPPLRRCRAQRTASASILDVVYNHLGPDGNYLPQFGTRLLHRPVRQRMGRRAQLRRAATRGPVREFVLANAELLDPRVSRRRLPARRHAADLRRSAEHIIAAHRASRAPGGRRTRASSSSSPRTSRSTRELLATVADGGYGLDAPVQRRLPPLGSRRPDRAAARPTTPTIAARPGAAVGRECADSCSRGSATRGRRSRGHAGARSAPRQFVHFLENHDQVANSAAGTAAVRARGARPAAGADGAAAARAGDAAALPGPGVRLDGALPVLRRTTSAELAARSGRAAASS